jgi:hypothetical protein
MTWKTAGQLVREMVERLERKGLGTTVKAEPSQVSAGRNGAGQTIDGNRWRGGKGAGYTRPETSSGVQTKSSVIAGHAVTNPQELLNRSELQKKLRAFPCFVGYHETSWSRLDPAEGSTGMFPP